MARLRPPKIPAQLTPVLDDAAIQSLLKACAGKDFAELRDTAIVRLFLDTGMRLDELAKLRVDDLDLDYDNTATVLGKGRRPRICPFGAKTAQALDRYLRQRARQKRSDVPRPECGKQLGRLPHDFAGYSTTRRRAATSAMVIVCRLVVTSPRDHRSTTYSTGSWRSTPDRSWVPPSPSGCCAWTAIRARRSYGLGAEGFCPCDAATDPPTATLVGHDGSGIGSRTILGLRVRE